MINTFSKPTWGRRDLVLLHLLVHHPGSQDKALRQELCRGCGEVTCSVCFLVAGPPASPEMTLVHSELSLPRSIRKCTTGLPVGQSGGGVFSIGTPFFQMALPCVKVDIKLWLHGFLMSHLLNQFLLPLLVTPYPYPFFIPSVHRCAKPFEYRAPLHGA